MLTASVTLTTARSKFARLDHPAKTQASITFASVLLAGRAPLGLHHTNQFCESETNRAAISKNVFYVLKV